MSREFRVLNNRGQTRARDRRREPRRAKHNNGCQRSGKLRIPARPPPHTYWWRNRTRDNRPAFEPALEVFGQVAGGLITRFRFAFQTARADCFQIAIQRRRECAKFGRRLLGGLLNDGKRVLSQKRRPASEQIEQNRAETVNISSGCETRRRSARLFGRNVTGCAENRERARKIARGVEPFGQTEIAHERFAAAIEHDVSRFQVAMQNTLDVRVLDGTRHLRHQRYAPA